MTHEWRLIDGHNLYEVSNYGHVRNIKTGKYIAQQSTYRGYMKVWLYIGDQKYQPCFVHRLVAIAFIGPPSLDLTVNHRDADKTNNCPENLEWLTIQENIQHACDIGLFHERKHYRIDYSKVNEVRALLNSHGLKELSKHFGCTVGAVVRFMKTHNIPNPRRQGENLIYTRGA